MCPRDEKYIYFSKCYSNGQEGHTLPVGACNNFAPGLNMCLSDPINPIKFEPKAMVCTGVVKDACSFCKAGKDLDGAYRFGETWAEREKYRTAQK